MTWKELFIYDRKRIKTLPDKIKFYSVFAMAGLVLGLGYGLAPFLYSKDYLVQQTKADLTHFMQTNKAIEDTRFSFLEKENEDGCSVFTGISKYAPYAISKVECKKEVQNEK